MKNNDSIWHEYKWLFLIIIILFAWATCSTSYDRVGDQHIIKVQNGCNIKF